MNKLFFLTLLIVNTSSFGQDVLLFHKNRYREAIYKVGDVISFQVKGDRAKITAEIKGFDDSVIVFKNYKVNPKEISHLFVDPKTRVWYALRYKYERIFLISGGGYLLLNLVNTGEITQETLIISGSLISAGLLARAVISWKVKIKGRRKLAIIRQ